MTDINQSTICVRIIIQEVVSSSTEQAKSIKQAGVPESKMERLTQENAATSEENTSALDDLTA